MTSRHRHFGHPSTPESSGLRLHGRRVMLRPLAPVDFPAWTEVRVRNEDWLKPWEPSRISQLADVTRSRDAYTNRCAARDRERMAGTGFGFGLFADNAFVGEVNINNIIRGALQSGTIGYWIDRAHAGHGYVAEGVAVAFRFAFEELHLHRLEICIVPRNTNSRRVMEKLEIREEGTAERYLEINGTWEDHVRFGITSEEWTVRQAQLAERWF
jgi:ribosomal-protein-alanine N-acetyltransferase